jgi:hypothetical protein
VGLGAHGGDRQHGVKPIERLNGRLLIHTKDGGVGGRVHVDPDDVGCFLLELCLVAGQVMAQAVRLQTVLLPDASHCHVAGFQAGGYSNGWCRHQDLGGSSPSLWFPSSRSPAASLALMACRQSSKARFQESGSPPLHIRDAAPQLGSHGSDASLEGKAQDHSCALGILSADGCGCARGAEVLGVRVH